MQRKWDTKTCNMGLHLKIYESMYEKMMAQARQCKSIGIININDNRIH